MLRKVSVILASLASVIGFAGLPNDAQAQKRVALVVGNSAYEYVPKLTNPANDARDIAAALKALGFEVVEGIDLDKAAFDRKVLDFAAAVEGASVGVFFYAGHGLQVAGENYLAPVDARLLTPTALDFELMKVAIIQRAMELSTKTNILFLDACRDNPLRRNLARSFGSRSADVGKGLAQIEAGSGTLISFSTQPGAVALDGKGRNSPYSEALIKHLSASDDDLNAILIAVRNDVMTETQDAQVPWENSALRGRVYFKEAASASGLSKAAPERGARHAAHSAGAAEPAPLRRPLTAEDTLAFDVTVSCEKLAWTSGDLYQKDAKLSVKSGRAEFSRPIHWPTVTDPVIGVEIGNGMVGSNGHLVVDAGWTSPRRRYRARYEGDVTTRGGVLTGGQDWISDGKSYRRNCVLELTAR